MRCRICGSELIGRAWCGISDYEYGTYRAVDYASCVRCGTTVQSPLPPANLIPSFYPSDYRNRLASGGGFFAFLKRAQTRRLASWISHLIGGADKKVLELGCGSGSLLTAFQDLGFRDLSGADFGDAVAPLLASRGIRFRRANIEAEFPFAERFDAVIMVNVIEHLLDPTGMLHRIREHLAPGGIVILITPNAEALDLAVFGRFWSGFHAPRHTVLFTRRGIFRMAAAVGFAGVTVRPLADPGQWGISLQNVLQASRLFRVRLAHGLAWYTLLLSVLAAPLAWLQNFLPGRSTAIMALLATGETKDSSGGL